MVTMKVGPWICACLLVLSSMARTNAFTFTLDRVECFHEHVPADQYTMVGFVVTSYEHYWSRDDVTSEVDMKVTDPSGKELLSVLKKSQDETYYYSQDDGYYKFCFHNLGHSHVQVSFELMSYNRWLQKDHKPLKEEEMDDVHKELQRLQNTLVSAHHEVWYGFFLAQQHIELDKALGRKIVRKTIFQGLLLVACSAAQILLLRRLVERRIRTSKV